MRLIPHLIFDGQCEAAFGLYKQCLDGELTCMLTYASQGILSTPELGPKIFHATLKMGDQTLTGVDVAHSAYQQPQGFSVQLNLEDANQARLIFASLSAGGAIHMHLQPTSWATHYAAFTDRFHIPWEINCGQ